MIPIVFLWCPKNDQLSSLKQSQIQNQITAQLNEVLKSKKHKRKRDEKYTEKISQQILNQLIDFISQIQNHVGKLKTKLINQDMMGQTSSSQNISNHNDSSSMQTLKELIQIVSSSQNVLDITQNSRLGNLPVPENENYFQIQLMCQLLLKLNEIIYSKYKKRSYVDSNESEMLQHFVRKACNNIIKAIQNKVPLKKQTQSQFIDEFNKTQNQTNDSKTNQINSKSNDYINSLFVSNLETTGQMDQAKFLRHMLSKNSTAHAKLQNPDRNRSTNNGQDAAMNMSNQNFNFSSVIKSQTYPLNNEEQGLNQSQHQFNSKSNETKLIYRNNLLFKQDGSSSRQDQLTNSFQRDYNNINKGLQFLQEQNMQANMLNKQNLNNEGAWKATVHPHQAHVQQSQRPNQFTQEANKNIFKQTIDTFNQSMAHKANQKSGQESNMNL